VRSSMSSRPGANSPLRSMSIWLKSMPRLTKSLFGGL
jgi:hypothetical protein